MESDSKEGPTVTMENLLKESEMLKKKLDDERQKLNDVTRKFILLLLFVITYFHLSGTSG